MTRRRDTLETALNDVFAKGDAGASWFALTGGRTLFSQGSSADTLYLLRSGRLGVFRDQIDQPPLFIGVVKPGEPVGEMALISGQAHSASVVALRDCEVMALPREAFFDAIQKRPDVMLELARLMLDRARDDMGGANAPNVFGFISLRPKPIRAFVERIAACLQTSGKTCRIIDHSALTSASEWFSRVEDGHDYVFYVAERDETAWARLCARQVDRLFLVGNPLHSPPLLASQTATNDTGPSIRHRFTDLILLRDATMTKPANTCAWLDALKPDQWFHVRESSQADTDRIARIVSGRAVGLVLSGGGARAYAHVGVVRALHEAGVRFDYLGGASMGAVIAAGPALGWSDETLYRRIHHAFVTSDPLSDLAFPLIAMTRARKVSRLLEEAYGEAEIADMPLPFFAVSANLTTGDIKVHRRGKLRHAIRASIAIPGVMPPVVMDGHVLVDGAVLKNFPTDVMHQLNTGPIIGSDTSQTRGVDVDTLENPPSWWQWLVSGAWKSGPPIVSILMRAATITTDVEIERSRKDTDLLILPKSMGSDIRDWKIYDPVVAEGEAAVREALVKAEPHLLSRLDLPVNDARKPSSEALPDLEDGTASQA